MDNKIIEYLINNHNLSNDKKILTEEIYEQILLKFNINKIELGRILSNSKIIKYTNKNTNTKNKRKKIYSIELINKSEDKNNQKNLDDDKNKIENKMIDKNNKKIRDDVVQNKKENSYEIIDVSLNSEEKISKKKVENKTEKSHYIKLIQIAAKNLARQCDRNYKKIEILEDGYIMVQGRDNLYYNIMSPEIKELKEKIK